MHTNVLFSFHIVLPHRRQFAKVHRCEIGICAGGCKCFTWRRKIDLSILEADSCYISCQILTSNVSELCGRTKANNFPCALQGTFEDTLVWILQKL